MLAESANQFSLEELCRTQYNLKYFFRSHVDHQTYGKTLSAIFKVYVVLQKPNLDCKFIYGFLTSLTSHAPGGVGLRDFFFHILTLLPLGHPCFTNTCLHVVHSLLKIHIPIICSGYFQCQASSSSHFSMTCEDTRMKMFTSSSLNYLHRKAKLAKFSFSRLSRLTRNKIPREKSGYFTVLLTS